jgi:hypothetical protein
LNNQVNTLANIYGKPSEGKTWIEANIVYWPIHMTNTRCCAGAVQLLKESHDDTDAAKFQEISGKDQRRLHNYEYRRRCAENTGTVYSSQLEPNDR